MEFRTKVPISEQEPKMDYRSKIFLTGSCFVENIGKKLDYYQFQSLQNPLGILFHPFAIENLFQKLASNYEYGDEDVFFHNERWHCFDAHSSLSSKSGKDLVEKLNSRLEETRNFLKEASHVVITLGTSWYYHHLESETDVANCHKLPQKNFRKALADPEEVKLSVESSLHRLKELAPGAKVIFTISPIRHLKDGFTENQWGKSNLITAIQKEVSYNSEVAYFPSYEIVMDELRDYRFFSEDMIHPNNIAISYIWENFVKAWMSGSAMATMREIEGVQRDLAHKPFNPESEAHKKFLEKLDIKIKDLESRFPHISF
ncbi:GSCFA domain-containing protein [Salegentibacter chungangensis]|uniref:GSCFA domain-containing protein n=1 Tax=Salegentibacter chungangensis TaxID=1335724 RepID=A0ABW3NQP0_9FLAO